MPRFCDGFVDKRVNIAAGCAKDGMIITLHPNWSH